MEPKTIINASLHIICFIVVLVMFYRMFTTHNPGKRVISWWLLKLSLASVIGMHLWSILVAFGAKIEPPNWMNATAWIGTLVCLFWAEFGHKWHNVKELKKEISQFKKHKHKHA